MKSNFSHILSTFPSLRSTLFIVLFLLIGNYHQAVEKQSDSQASENDISFMYAPRVEFNDEYVQYIESKLDNLLKRRGFNGSVMIAHGGEAVYNKSFGYSKFSDRTEFAPENNIFQLASVGKQFTAFAILILYEQGLINLDDRVADYIEDFPYPDINVRHMLNHTSGLQNYFYLIDNYWEKDYLPVHQDMLDLINAKSLPLNFTPGRRFSYSNTGYAFLAMLVEKISGQSFASFVQENIFDPLNMKNSFVFHPSLDLKNLSVHSNFVPGHERAGRWLREIPVDFNDGITGDKGIFSCTSDLLKWDNALENSKLVKETTRQMAFETGKLKNGYRTNYGFGFRIKTSRDQNIIYHNGWWKGFRTAYVRLPDNTLIVILNNTTSSISGLDNQIRKIVNASPVPVFNEQEEMMAMLAPVIP